MTNLSWHNWLVTCLLTIVTQDVRGQNSIGEICVPKHVRLFLDQRHFHYARFLFDYFHSLEKINIRREILKHPLVHTHMHGYA